MKQNGIKHIRTAPYHPASNGEAERFVQTFKQSLRASKSDEGTSNEKLSRFLLRYRNTPHSTTGVTPAELFMKRPLRTRLDLLKPCLRSKVLSRQADQKRQHDAHSRNCEFDVGETVLARNLRDGPKWLTGTIVERTGPVSYRVQVNDQIWRRHTDQLLSSQVSVPEVVPEPLESQLTAELPRKEAVESPPQTQSDQAPEEPTVQQSETTIQPQEQKQYPKRIRKPPDRFSHEISAK